MKKSVEVTIDGKSIRLKTDYEQTYIDELTEYVEQHYLEVRTVKPGNPYRQAVLAALNIADELFKERSRNDELREDVEQRCRRILDLIRSIDSTAAQ